MTEHVAFLMKDLPIRWIVRKRTLSALSKVEKNLVARRSAKHEFGEIVSDAPPGFAAESDRCPFPNKLTRPRHDDSAVASLRTNSA